MINTNKGESACAQAGLPLAAGLKDLDTTLILANGKCGLTDADGAMILYTDYAPLRSQTRIKRWRTYGAPPQPYPEHQDIDGVLRRWTRSPKMPTITIHETKDGQLQKSSLKKKCRIWLQDSVSRGRVQSDGLRPIPLL